MSNYISIAIGAGYIGSHCFDLGHGCGHSVPGVTTEKVTSKKIKTRMGKKRAAGPGGQVSDSRRASGQFGWYQLEIIADEHAGLSGEKTA
jgi:UDP-glucose 4-epimerase